MSRAAQLDCQHLRSCALVLTLFLFQKGQGFFPPLPIAALLPRSRRGAYLPLARWDASMWLGDFAARINRLDFCVAKIPKPQGARLPAADRENGNQPIYPCCKNYKPRRSIPTRKG